MRGEVFIPLAVKPTVLQTVSEQALTCTAAATAAHFGTHSAHAGRALGDRSLDSPRRLVWLPLGGRLDIRPDDPVERRQPANNDGMQPSEFHELYHGTAASRVASIRATGLAPQKPPRYPESWSMLTSSREVAEGWARLQSPGDRAVIAYRVPVNLVDEFLYPPVDMDRARNGQGLWAAHQRTGYPGLASGIQLT